jgi:hypothetical protein
MSFHNSVRPIIAPHYHCDNSLTSHQPIHHNPNNLNPYYNFLMYPYVNPIQQYSTYDPVTGEYLRAGQQTNQMPLITNYRERESIICCKFCQTKIPVNCLTVSLTSSLMLLMMFSLIQLIIDANSKNSINSVLLKEMIWIMTSLVLIVSFLIIIRYFYNNRHKKLCSKCRSSEEEDRNDSFNYYSYDCNEQFV